MAVFGLSKPIDGWACGLSPSPGGVSGPVSGETGPGEGRFLERSGSGKAVREWIWVAGERRPAYPPVGLLERKNVVFDSKNRDIPRLQE